MKRTLLTTSLAATLFLGVAMPLLAAEASSAPPSSVADKCVSDLRAFDKQLQKDGYWLGGYGAGGVGLDGYGGGYGYPVGGYGYEYGAAGSQPDTDLGYIDARPGYEIRVLLGAADVLAQHDEQQPCEDVLTAARDHYKQYIADMEAAHMPMANVPGWQRRQIAVARPVTSMTTVFRPDQYVGTDVRNPQNQALGSVDDVIMTPQTGKIGYLVISRGGWLFGIGQKHVAVPWDDFAIAPDATLLVLNVSKNVMDAAPQGIAADIATSARQRGEVDAYWKAHFSSQGAN